VPKLSITWVKSSIGYSQGQKQTIRALGFRRLNQRVEKERSPEILGMVAKVRHLVDVEELDDSSE